MGTRTIIASVVPVPDAGAKRLMIALHRHLTAGDSPSVALAKAQAATEPARVRTGRVRLPGHGLTARRRRRTDSAYQRALVVL